MYKLAINRPITTLMYVITLVIFGYMSFKSMPSALFPNIDFPIVTITTQYAGAESSTIESQVTDKIEEAISRIGGVDSISSTSSEGMSVVMVNQGYIVVMKLIMVGIVVILGLNGMMTFKSVLMRIQIKKKLQLKKKIQ